MADTVPEASPAHTDEPARPDRGIRRWLWSLLKVAVAAGLLTYLVRSGRLDSSMLARVRMGRDLIVLLALILAALLLPCLRWQWMLGYQGVRIRFLTALQMTWIGYFFGLFLPGAASGDVARAYYVMRDVPEARLHSASTVLVDRAMGLYSLLFLGLVPAGVLQLRGQASPTVTGVATLTIVLLVVTTAAMVALAVPPTRRLLLTAIPGRARGALDDCLSRYCARPWGLAACFALSLMSNACNALAFVSAAGALGTRLAGALSLLIGPLVILANSLPISPGGIGVAESTASSLFAGAGFAHGAEAMLLMRLAIMLCALPGALCYIAYRTRS